MVGERRNRGESDFDAKAVREATQLVYACTSGDRLIGYFLVVLEGGEALLELLCSKFPSSSELRLGVGSTLLRVAESVVRAKGYRELRVPQAVGSAVTFYLDRGYRVVGGSSVSSFFTNLSKTL